MNIVEPEHSTALSPSARFVRYVLDSKPGLTYSDIIKATGYDERSIRRAIEELRTAGISVHGEGRPLKFFLQQELRRSDKRVVSLNEEEILALRLAAQVARSVLAPTPIAEHLQSAFERLLAEMDERDVSIDQETQGKQWHFGDAPSAPIDAGIFNQLRRAIRNAEYIRIDYHAAHSGQFWPKRRLTPFCIAASSGTWLLVAWCHERKGMREFNLVDIRNVYSWEPAESEIKESELAEETAFDPDLYFRDRFRHLGGDTVHEVRLLVEPLQSRYFKRKFYHPTQQIEVEREDGRIVVSYEIEGLDELRSFAQSWGTGVTVLEPEELRQMLEEQAEEILRRYRRSKKDKPTTK